MLNWNQAGMPSALVSRLGQRREIAEFKSVLNEAQNHVMHPADTEAMAQELVLSGGREFVEMVQELTAALVNAKKELEDANRRYERLTADLARRGIGIADGRLSEPQTAGLPVEPSDVLASAEGESPAKSVASTDGLAEWEEWDRRFRSLLG